MASKLGSVDLTDDIRTKLKQFSVVEGSRRTESLIAEAEKAYRKVITVALGKSLEKEKSLSAQKPAAAPAKP